MINEAELNNKLAKWAGWKIQGNVTHWYEDDKGNPVNPPDFTQNIKSCFDWLVPKLLYAELKMGKIGNGYYSAMVENEPVNRDWYYQAKSPALALCLAIEKLIDAEDKHNG
jgi:hypothetical protein